MKKTTKYALALILIATAAWATDAKISALTLGDPVQLADQFPINRGGTNYRITGEALAGEQCSKSLTESSATSVVQVSVASGAAAGGTLTFHAFASDGTEHQDLVGMLYFAAVNKGGTETCTTPTVVGTALNAVSTGTLTCTYACDTSPTNGVNIQLNCVSSLNQNVFTAWTRTELIGGGTPTCQ